MYCNKDIHYALNENAYVQCPFCYKIIGICNSKKYKCCLVMNVGHLNNSFVCLNCASVHGYQRVKEYINFYENRYRIKRKSVYNRKYHLQNRIRTLCVENNVQISYHKQQKILQIFEKIDNILSIVNNNLRKRMIKIDCILKILFEYLGIKIEITQSSSNKTSVYNKQYWEKINSLIGDEIQAILDR